MSNIEKILLDAGYNGIKYLKDYSYDTAVVGVSDDNRVIYDYDKMVNWLIETENMTLDDAIEWIDYNTIRALSYFGEGSPIIMFPIINT